MLVSTYLPQHGKKWVTESTILIMRGSIFQHPGILISYYYNACSSHKAYMWLPESIPPSQYSMSQAAQRVLGLLNRLWLWKITTLNETAQASLISFYWSLWSILVQNGDIFWILSAISYSGLMSFNSFIPTTHYFCLLYLFLVEGASEVHLALPVSKLAGSRRAQWARWCPLVSRGGQPHPEHHSRHWTHCCPLQVWTGRKDIA